MTLTELRNRFIEILKSKPVPIPKSFLVSEKNVDFIDNPAFQKELIKFAKKYFENKL